MWAWLRCENLNVFYVYRINSCVERLVEGDVLLHVWRFSFIQVIVIQG